MKDNAEREADVILPLTRVYFRASQESRVVIHEGADADSFACANVQPAAESHRERGLGSFIGKVKSAGRTEFRARVDEAEERMNVWREACMVAPFDFRPTHEVRSPRVNSVILYARRAGCADATGERSALELTIGRVDRKIAFDADVPVEVSDDGCLKAHGAASMAVKEGRDFLVVDDYCLSFAGTATGRIAHKVFNFRSWVRGAAALCQDKSGAAKHQEQQKSYFKHSIGFPSLALIR